MKEPRNVLVRVGLVVSAIVVLVCLFSLATKGLHVYAEGQGQQSLTSVLNPAVYIAPVFVALMVLFIYLLERRR